MGELDKVFEILTRGYCIERNEKGECGINKVGCCQIKCRHLDFKNNHYEKPFNKLQVIESRNYSNKKNVIPHIDICKYHNVENGCMLKLTKPPICVGFLCGSLRRHLRYLFGDICENFLRYTDRIVDFGFKELFGTLECMEAVIKEGRKLINGKREQN